MERTKEMEEKKKTEKDKDLSLDEKLQEIKKEVMVMHKATEGHGYRYVDEESILLKINDKMLEMGLRLIPKFKPNTLTSEIFSYINNKGKENKEVIVKADLEFIWKDIKTKEQEVVDWGLVGQQSDGSQALGSGLTYANRYFLLKFFNVATSKDDPDKIRAEQQKEEERKRLSLIQTKIKELLPKLLSKYQSQEMIYEKMGTTKEQFTKDYNNKEKWETLLEQMELIMKEEIADVVD